MQEAIDADVLDKIFIDKNDGSTSSSKKVADDTSSDVDDEEIQFQPKRKFQNVVASAPSCSDSIIEKLARIDNIGNINFRTQDVTHYNIRAPIDSYLPNDCILPYHIMMMSHSSNSDNIGGFNINNHASDHDHRATFSRANINIGNDYVNALHYGELNSRRAIFDQLSNPVSPGSLNELIARHH